jgi:DNA-binding CsgD family transcriptional regulator
LIISLHTVNFHVKNIFSKTDAANRAEASAFAAHHGLV